MPIEFECEDCGKKLRVRDDLAGKRAKCPGCGAALTVPSGLEEVEPERPAPRKAAIAPAPARREATRPRDDEEDRPAAKRRRDEDEDDRPARRRDRDDDLEDQDEDRPRRGGKKAKGKSGSSVLPLVLGISAGALGLLLVGGLLWWLLSGLGGGAGQMAAFVPGDGQMFASIRVADLWKSEVVKNAMAAAKQAQPGMPDPTAEAEKNFGLKPEEVDRATIVVQDDKGRMSWSIIETVAAYDQAKIKGKMTNPTEQTHEGKKYLAGGFGGGADKMAVYFAGPKLFVIGPEEGVKQALSVSAKRKAGPLDDGLALVGTGKHVVAGFSLPAEARNQMRQAAQNPMAKQFAPIGEFQSGTVALNVGNTLDVETGLKFADGTAAKAGKDAADAAVKMAQGLMPLMKGGGGPNGPPPAAMDAAEKALNGLKVEQRGSSVVFVAKFEGVGDAAKGLIPMLGKMGPGGMGAGGGMRNSNNLKQIGIAMHFYHDVYKGLPTDIVDAKGQPLLSWRVAILPYIEQDALYRRFKLNERWDSQHNMALMREMPATYADPNGKGGVMTFYQRFRGQRTLFPDDKLKMPFTRVTDGTSNTIMAFEGSRAVQWTKPDDAVYNPSASPKSVMRLNAGSYTVLMADGSVRQVRSTVSDKTLHAAITAAGGEVLGPDW